MSTSFDVSDRQVMLVALLVLLGSVLLVSVVVANHTQNEPNDSMGSAVSVTGGSIATTETGTASSLTGNVNNNGDYDEDWFSFTADGSEVTVVMESDPLTEGDLGFEVLDSGSSVIGSNNTGHPTNGTVSGSISDANAADTDGDSNYETKVNLTGLTDGDTYYIKVFAYDDHFNDPNIDAAQECGLSSDGDASCDGEYELFLSFPPNADAGSDTSVNVDQSMTFDGSATSDPDDSQSSLTFDWDFGDGTTQSGTGLTSPSHTYTTSGTYTVTLTVTDSGGGTSTDTVTVEVCQCGDSPPSANALANQYSGSVTVSEDTPVKFDGTMSSGDIETYEWSFDDGTTAQSSWITHTFDTPGTYDVTLATHGNSQTDSDAVTVTVTDETSPTAVVGDDRTVGLNETVSFDAGNSTDNGNIARYDWQFGDGSTATGEQATHAFADIGTYDVELTVTDGGDNSDTIERTITVADTTPPTADAGSDQTVAVGSPVTLSGATSTDNHEISAYEWTFDDGSTATSVRATHTYDTMGSYTATLTVTDSSGNTAIDTVTVVATAENDTVSPTTATGPDRTVTVDTPVVLNASASTDNGVIVDYTWQIDNDTHSGATVSRTFAHPGVYTGTVEVTDASGNTGTGTVAITVKDRTPPTVSVGPSRTVTSNATVGFDASNSSDNSGIEQYRWTVEATEVVAGYETPEPVTLEGATPNSRFTVPGNYTVTLTVTDEGGNTATVRRSITVEDTQSPIARAGSSRTVEVGEQVQLDGTNSTDDIGITRYVWGVGERTVTVTGSTATHTYDEEGVYVVALTVFDGSGNRDTDFVTITVE